MYDIRTARSAAELEAVFRFRYENHFRLFRGGYPGLDHQGRRVFEPHDLASAHTCAFDPDGRLVAVSTATPADAPGLPEEWTAWFALDRLAPLGLSRLVVSTRMVLDPALRGSGLFREFYLAVVGGYIRSGVLASLHYSRPGLVPRYETLGHRRYARPFNLPGGELRLPLIIAFNDPEFLAMAGFPLAGESAREAVRRDFPPVAELKRLLPELDSPPKFSRLPSGDRALLVSGRLLRAGAAGAIPPASGVPALARTALIPLAPGQTLHALDAERQLGFVLTGSLRLSTSRGSRLLAPGDFLGLAQEGEDLSEYTAQAETPAEMLVFDSTLVRQVLETPGGPPGTPDRLWEALGRAAFNGTGKGTDHPRPAARDQEHAPCGTPL